MQLDQTHVAIRTRHIGEIGDLAFLTLRRYFRPIASTFFWGALPWAIINMLLLVPPLVEGWSGSYEVDQWQSSLAKYMIWMVTLVSLQTPAAGVATTVYLGQAVFESEPSTRSVWRDVRAVAKTWIWILGVIRLPILAMIWVAFRITMPFDSYDALMPLLFLVVAGIMRANRPFMPEILLLEQCPARDRTKQRITASMRSKRLHRPYAADLNGRLMVVMVTLAALSLAIFGAADGLLKLVFGPSNLLSQVQNFVVLPLAVWLVACFSIVIRLLSYLDCRIRLEGWDVELAVRAEAIRQFGEADQTDQLTPDHVASGNRHPSAPETATA